MSGVNDVYFTSLREAKGEAERAVSPVAAPRPAFGAKKDPSGSDERGVYLNLTQSLAAGLTSRLERFSNELSRFSWPAETSPWSSARLTTSAPGLEGKIAAEAVPALSASPPDKYFTRGGQRLARSGLTPGDYEFSLEQGGVVQEFAVTVSSRDTWGDVLDNLALAINGANALTVRAEVRYQPSPFMIDPSLATTGTVLALSVNPLRQGQDLTLRDTSGHLLKELGLAEVPRAIDPAEKTSYLVSAPKLAQPSSAASRAFDPNAATTLSLGRHDFAMATGSLDSQPTSYVSRAFDPTATGVVPAGDYAIEATFGDETRTVTLTVTAQKPMAQILREVGQAVATQAGLDYAVGDSPIPSAATAGIFSDGEALTLATTSPLTSQGFRLSDASGDLLSRLGLTTPLKGDVVSVTVQAGFTWGEVTQRLAEAAGLTSAAVHGKVVFEPLYSYDLPGWRIGREGQAAVLTLINPKIGERMTLTDGPTGLLASLGLDRSLPGQDGAISVNGNTLVSENNAYALDRGRLVLAAADNVAEPLPLAVVSAMEEIESRVGAMVESYNDVRRYLSANAVFFSASLGQRLAAPVADNWSGLSELGFSQTGREGMLWINRDAFWQKLGIRPYGARETLVDGAGALVPSWSAAVSDILSSGAPSFLTPETLHLDRVRQPRTFSDLERKNRLIDLSG